MNDRYSRAPGEGRLVYGLAVLCGAVLVFQVQPIAGRFLLPDFGGGAAVWTACMFFFQFALLAGYAWAHVLTKWALPRRQAALHAVLLVLSIPFLPLTIRAGYVSESPPAVAIWALLIVSIGVPFVALAGTAPLMQRWFSLTEPARSPYRLYAVSNAGALAALLTYPFLVEPNLALESQAIAWSGGYVAFLAVSFAACRHAWRRQPPGSSSDAGAAEATFSLADSLATLVLAACGVVMLLAVTNQVTQNVAPIPFLWVLPLVVYLLTWIVAFSGERIYDRSIWGSLFTVAACCLVILEFFGTSFDIVTVILAYLLALGCIGIVCHGEVYRLRPAPGRLGAYYLLIAAGGALGGAFVSVVAPLLFDRYWEGIAGVYLLYLVFGALVLREYRRERDAPPRAELAASHALLDRWARRLFATGWSIGILLFPAVVLSIHSLLPKDDIVALRNFYGTLNVRDVIRDGPPRRQLVDGTTIHGFQILDSERADTPTSYYARNTGIGQLLEALQRDRDEIDIGVVGLGAGTLAAYGRPDDRIRFYELNPAVASVAEQYFTFLEDSQAAVDVVIGDARISMEVELEDGGNRDYDVLAIDAFSSGAIPVHLLTREAHALYWSHLADNGVLAFHVTNEYLRLAPVVANVAAALGKQAVMITTGDDAGVSTPADWVLVFAGDTIPAGLPENLLVRLSARQDEAVWTDDYSDLLGTLRR